MTGEELKEKRKSLGYTQEEFAKKLMVATNTVARWEREERAIPPYLPMALSTIEKTVSKVGKPKTGRPPKS